MKWTPYRSPSVERRARTILNLTATDSQGRIFYRHQPGSWKRLKAPADYLQLNTIIDQQAGPAALSDLRPVTGPADQRQGEF